MACLYFVLFLVLVIYLFIYMYKLPWTYILVFENFSVSICLCMLANLFSMPLHISHGWWMVTMLMMIVILSVMAFLIGDVLNCLLVLICTHFPSSMVYGDVWWSLSLSLFITVLIDSFFFSLSPTHQSSVYLIYQFSHHGSVLFCDVGMNVLQTLNI